MSQDDSFNDLSDIINSQQNTPRRRGRPRGSRSNKQQLIVRTEQSSIRPKRKKKIYFDEEEEDDSIVPGLKPPPLKISRVVAYPYQYLNKVVCSLDDKKSHIHYKTFTLEELQKSSHTNNVLAYYLDNYNGDAKFDCSSIFPQCIDPYPKDTSRLSREKYFAERILSHKSSKDEADYVIHKHVNYEDYQPGLPVDKCEFDIITAKRYQMVKPSDFSDNFISFDGSFYIDRNPQQEQIDTPVNTVVSRDPSDDTVFLIKWKGAGESAATWEIYSDLSGDNQLVANKGYLKFIISRYWSRVRSKLQSYNGSKLRLSDEQSNVVDALMNCTEKSIALDCTCDRVTIISAFCNKYKYLKTKRIIIVSTGSEIDSWCETLDFFPELYWICFRNNSKDREIVRRFEINPEKVILFDVLVVDVDCVELETNSISCLKWDYVVFDKRFKDFSCNMLAEFKTITLTNNTSGYSYDKVLSFQINKFSYKEELHLLKDPTCYVLRDYIHKEIFPNIPTDEHVSSVSTDLFETVVAYYSHPTIISYFNDRFEAIYRDQNEFLHPTQKIDRESYVDILMKFSMKIVHLLELISQLPSKNIIVFSNFYTVLEQIREILSFNNIQCSILNHINFGDYTQPSSPFPRNTILLSDRNINPDIIEMLNSSSYTLSSIIFFDLPNRLNDDINIVRYFSLHGSINIYRIIHADSLETLIYSQFLRNPYLSKKNFTSSDHSIYARAITFLIKDRVKNGLPPTIVYDIVTEADEVATRIDTVYDLVKDDDNYWNEVFPSETGQRISGIRFKAGDIKVLVDYIKSRCLDYERIAERIDRSVDEVRPACRHILIQHLIRAHATRSYIKNEYAILQAILQNDMFDVINQNAFDAGYWSEVYKNDIDISSLLLSSRHLLKSYEQPSSFLRQCSKNIMIRLYMVFHPTPQLPPGFYNRNYNVPLGSLYHILDAFMDSGYTEKSVRDPIRISQDEIAIMRNEIVPSMIADTLFRCFKTDTNIHKHISSIRSVLVNGPYCNLDQLKKADPDLERNVLNQVLQHGLLLNDDGSQNYFGAFLLTARCAILSPDDCQRLYTDALNKIGLNRLRDVLNIRKLLNQGPATFLQEPGLPSDWDIEADIDLMKAALQYGLDKLCFLPEIPFNPPHQDSPDYMTSRSFNNFSQQVNFLIKRLLGLLHFNFPLPPIRQDVPEQLTAMIEQSAPPRHPDGNSGPIFHGSFNPGFIPHSDSQFQNMFTGSVQNAASYSIPTGMESFNKTEHIPGSGAGMSSYGNFEQAVAVGQHNVSPQFSAAGQAQVLQNQGQIMTQHPNTNQKSVINPIAKIQNYRSMNSQYVPMNLPQNGTNQGIGSVQQDGVIQQQNTAHYPLTNQDNSQGNAPPYYQRSN